MIQKSKDQIYLNLNLKVILENMFEKGNEILFPLPPFRPLGLEPPPRPLPLPGPRPASQPAPPSPPLSLPPANRPGPPVSSISPKPSPASPSLLCFNSQAEAPAPTISSSPHPVPWSSSGEPRAHLSNPPPPFSFPLVFAPLVLAHKSTVEASSAAARVAPPIEPFSLILVALVPLLSRFC